MKKNTDDRFVLIDGVAEGPFNIAKIGRMRKNSELSQDDLFWSERKQEWIPIAGLIFDIVPEPDRAEFLDLGFVNLEVLLSDNEDCPACVAVAGVYPISSAPELPPFGCTCMPWCRCLIVVSEVGLK